MSMVDVNFDILPVKFLLSTKFLVRTNEQKQFP